MAEPTRMLIFGDVLTETQTSVIRSIYHLLKELPEEVRRVIVKDLADTYRQESDKP